MILYEYDNDRLERCPHCGGLGLMTVDSPNCEYFVQCIVCGAKGGTSDKDDWAAEKWNLRK